MAETSEPQVVVEADRALRRAVLAYEAEEWRNNDAATLVQELLALVKNTNDPSRRAEVLRRAEAFIGQRQVAEDTTPVARPRRGILRRRNDA